MSLAPPPQAPVGVNRALSEANRLLSAAPLDMTTPTPQLKFVALPNGEFGEPSRNAPLNNNVRVPSSRPPAPPPPPAPAFDPTANAGLPFNNFGFATVLGSQQQQQQQQQPPQQQQPVGQTSFDPKQFFAATNPMQSFAPQQPAPPMIPAQPEQPTMNPPSTNQASTTAPAPVEPPRANKEVTFHSGSFATDTDTNPISNLNPPHYEGDSVHLSILKARKTMDTPKPEHIEDDDSDEDEWVLDAGDDTDDDDDDDEDDEPLVADENEPEPVSAIRDFGKNNAPRVEPLQKEEVASTTSVLDRLLSRKTDTATSDSTPEPSFGSTFRFPTAKREDSSVEATVPARQMPDFNSIPHHTATVPRPSFQTPTTTNVENTTTKKEVGFFRKGINYMKGVDGETGKVDKDARNKRIIIASVLLFAVVCIVIGIIYWKFFSGKREKKKDKEEPKNAIAVKQETQPPKNAHTSNDVKSVVPTNARDQTTPTTPSPVKVAGTDTAIGQKPIVDFDLLSREVQMSVGDSPPNTTSTAATSSSAFKTTLPDVIVSNTTSTTPPKPPSPLLDSKIDLESTMSDTENTIL